MLRFWKTYVFGLLCVLVTGCSSEHRDQEQIRENIELTVSAAASLQDALNEIKDSYEEENKGVKIFYNFGASGALQQQISQGAPVDIFISAAEDKFNQLMTEGLIEKETSVDLVGNELVLVVPRDNDKEIKRFGDLVLADKISIGTPETVPAGKYGKETLENLQLWNSVKEKMVYAKDVRQVLTYVETHNVDAGLVYKTDALLSEDVKITEIAGEGSHTPIIYPMGKVKKSKHPVEADYFLDYLQSEASMKVLEKYGFKNVK